MTVFTAKPSLTVRLKDERDENGEIPNLGIGHSIPVECVPVLGDAYLKWVPSARF